MIDNVFPIQKPLLIMWKHYHYNEDELCYGLHPDRIEKLAKLKDDTIVVVNEQTGDRFSYNARKVKKCPIHPIPRDLYIVRESIMTKLEPEVEPESGSKEEYYKYFV